MAKRLLGLEHLPLLEKLQAVLNTEPNPVNQQIAVELLTVGLAGRMGDLEGARTILDGIYKHTKQLLESSTNNTIAEGAHRLKALLNLGWKK